MLGMDVALAFSRRDLHRDRLPAARARTALCTGRSPTYDLPVIMGIVLVVSVAVVIMNLIADILYCVIDPRISLRGGSSS